MRSGFRCRSPVRQAFIHRSELGEAGDADEVQAVFGRHGSDLEAAVHEGPFLDRVMAGLSAMGRAQPAFFLLDLVPALRTRRLEIRTDRQFHPLDAIQGE